MHDPSDEPGWLYLHVGHGKTGSSYLQSWLAINAEALARGHGLAYPLRAPSGRTEDDAARSRFSMGNGFVLEEVLSLDEEAARRALGALRGDARSILFSCERFLKSLRSRLADVETLALASGLRGVRHLLFLRDPLEHALSLYAEMVKAHGCTEGVDAWLGRYDLLDHVEAYLAEVGRLPRSELTVASYSRAEGRVLERLLDWLRVPLEAALPLPAHERVNRSLTASELELQVLCNRLLGREAAAIGTRLVEELPAVPAAPPRASDRAREAFVRRLAPQVERLNRELPEAERYALDPGIGADTVRSLGAAQLRIVCTELARGLARRLRSALR